MENIFYELEICKTGWKFNDPEPFFDMMNQIMDNIINYFVGSFKFFEVALYNEKITSKNSDKYTAQLKYFIKDFGKRFSANKSQKSQSLLQYISKFVDFETLLPNLPKILKIDEDEKMIFAATASSLKESLIKEEKRIAGEVEVEREDENEQQEEEEEEGAQIKKNEEKPVEASDSNGKTQAENAENGKESSGLAGKIVEVYRKK